MRQKKYNAIYFYNKKRKGVAASRDFGISKIQTPYFMLLDGHMRFYQNDWVEIILDAINKDERAIYCCRCKNINISKGENIGHAAYLRLFNNEIKDVLTLDWIKEEYALPDTSIIDVPCVLGASYIASKNYWEYLKGLEGLKYYSCDEQYISLKTWMEGGRCRLIKQVDIGHLFRKKAPYEINQFEFFYNKLLIIETLLPEALQKKLIRSMKAINYIEYMRAKNEMDIRKAQINSMKKYYSETFKSGLNSFMQINDYFLEKHTT